MPRTPRTEAWAEGETMQLLQHAINKKKDFGFMMSL